MTLQTELSASIANAMGGFQLRQKVEQLARESAIEAGIPDDEIDAFVQATTASMRDQLTELA